MKVSGFTFVRNAIRFGYPVEAAIRSVLPLVDEMVVCVGNSDDGTLELIKSIDKEKIRIVETVWDDSLREGGKVLAVETNKALDAVAAESNWLFYIQADEVVHEQYYPVIKASMERYLDNQKVEGLLFNYHHFYGSYRYIGDGRAWYSKEIRIIRNDKRIRSYRDAQGFRWQDNRKLNVKLIDAYIYHYGWVRNPLTMWRKIRSFSRLYNPELAPVNESENVVEDKFDYSGVDTVMLFKGTHPAVMKDIIANADWDFNRDTGTKKFKNIKHRILYFLWQKFGWRPFEYSNYKRI